MGNAYTISVGADTKAEYLAFGDDSQFGDTLAFAFVVLKRSRLTYAEDRLRGLKQLYRIPNDVRLHCRVLFNENARNKAGLTHLTHDDARAIVRRAVRLINRVPMMLRYSHDSLSRFANALGSQIELTHETDGSKTTLPVTPDPKGVLGILMQTCLIVSPDGSQGPTASQCEIFVAEDPTKVGFIGPRRRRADRMYSGFSDVGAPSGGVFQLQPTALKAGDAPMLQLADIAAYMCSHAIGASVEQNFFREQLGMVTHWTRAGMGP